MISKNDWIFTHFLTNQWDDEHAKFTTQYMWYQGWPLDHKLTFHGTTHQH